MSDEWEQHREQYAAERSATFDGYVDVWSRDADTRRKFSDWLTFAQCANAELAKIREVPDLVRTAEAIMSRNGYRIGPAAPVGGRTWIRTDGKLRSDYSNPATARPAGTSTRKRASRAISNKPSNKASNATARVPARAKAAAAPPKPPARPRMVECPNDPGMMVPLEGSCMCGWSPTDAD